ncbi:hypothetical protein PR048_007933 [Dryococelus australis]|uniref:Uncharacterized protein n=1 Tax=Dryococelus australis TaxID=614101 RepID=A0ABQ9HXB5_9NEOP|nr:hypothetical protein PR048_007933 [Dryococelus australis]
MTRHKPDDGSAWSDIVTPTPTPGHYQNYVAARSIDPSKFATRIFFSDINNFTKAIRVQSPTGSPYFHMWESCRAMPLVGGFFSGSPVSPGHCIPALLHTHLTSTLIDSQCLDVLCRPNLCTPLKDARSCRSDLLSTNGSACHSGHPTSLDVYLVSLSVYKHRADKYTEMEQFGGFFDVSVPILIGCAKLWKQASSLIGDRMLQEIPNRGLPSLACCQLNPRNTRGSTNRLSSRLPGADWRTAFKHFVGQYRHLVDVCEMEFARLLSSDIWAALNNEILRGDELEMM